MKIKVLFLLLVSVIVFVLSACKMQTNQDSNGSEISSSSSVNSESGENKEVVSGTELKFQNTFVPDNCFEEDYVWTQFTENNTSRCGWGCYDKKGKVIYKTYDAVTGVDGLRGFSENYCYIFSDELSADGLFNLSVVDKNGEIRGTYLYCHPENPNYKNLMESNDLCIAYGGGCVVIQKHITDFDSNHYEYTICDENKKTIANTKYEQPPKVKYAGKGVWGFIQNENTKYYFRQSNKWVDLEDAETITFDCDYQIYKSSVTKVSVVNIKGETQEIDLSKEFEYTVSVSGVSDNKFLVYYGNKEYNNFQLGVYDINTRTFKKQTNYLNKIDEESLKDEKFIDNRIILNLIGSDGKTYYALFDENWNTIMEPFTSENHPEINSQRIVINHDVYDLNGKLLFSIDSKLENVQKINPNYSDGCLKIVRQINGVDSLAFVDVDGNLLFEKEGFIFDDSGSKEISVK